MTSPAAFALGFLAAYVVSAAFVGLLWLEAWRHDRRHRPAPERPTHLRRIK